MSLVVYPFRGLQFAYPSPMLRSGSGKSEEQQSRKTGFECLKMLNGIEDWTIPFHNKWNVSRWIDDTCYRVMVVD